MIIRTSCFAFVLIASVGLAGCNETMGGPGPVASTPIAASSYSLPPDAPCTREIDTYNGVVAHDLETGNVEQKVADKIHAELARAASACSAGKGGEAHAIVASSKAAHGYRA